MKGDLTAVRLEEWSMIVRPELLLAANNNEQISKMKLNKKLKQIKIG